jgi:hypothetical protein
MHAVAPFLIVACCIMFRHSLKYQSHPFKHLSFMPIFIATLSVLTFKLWSSIAVFLSQELQNHCSPYHCAEYRYSCVLTHHHHAELFNWILIFSDMSVDWRMGFDMLVLFHFYLSLVCQLPISLLFFSIVFSKYFAYLYLCFTLIDGLKWILCKTFNWLDLLFTHP